MSIHPPLSRDSQKCHQISNIPQEARGTESPPVKNHLENARKSTEKLLEKGHVFNQITFGYKDNIQIHLGSA